MERQESSQETKKPFVDSLTLSLFSFHARATIYKLLFSLALALYLWEIFLFILQKKNPNEWFPKDLQMLGLVFAVIL